MKLLLIVMLMLSDTAQAYSTRHTDSGVEYGIAIGNSSKPLVLVFTTDIHDSMTGLYTTVPKFLHDAGYTIAAIDVTCHGKDGNAGLDCWASRISTSKADIFAPMVNNASAVITDISAHHFADTSHVIAVGVSRGGYSALRVASKDVRINRLVLMAPVTDLRKLTEFAHTPVDAHLYGFTPDYYKLSKDHIFLVIGNADDRVGTFEALQFVEDVGAAGVDRVADITAMVVPTALHKLAAKWAMGEFSATAFGAKHTP